MVPYHKFNEKKELNKVIKYLNEGRILSLISDAGTPLLSDPGHLLVRECLDRKISVYPIPGPSSITTSMSVSGFEDKFVFYGFLPKKEKELKKEKDALERDLLQIDIDELKWIVDSQKQEAHHRIRELEHWSRIKAELDDGSFDTVDPNTHQQVSLPKRFEHDMKSLTPGTSASEARNIVGLHATAARIEQTRLEQDKKERLTANTR